MEFEYNLTYILKLCFYEFECEIQNALYNLSHFWTDFVAVCYI